MSHSCTVCNKSFSTSSNRSRHQNTAHGPGIPSQSSIVVNGSSVMQHPFTCIVAGCTQSGKSVCVATKVLRIRIPRYEIDTTDFFTLIN